MYQRFFKRIFDFTAALIGLIILSPIFVLVFSILLIAYKGRPFFVQERPGKNERIFKIIKFRTMTDKRDKNGNLLPEKDRITRIGLLTRKSSLDEIPQLFNVIKGDISLVGPRPLLVKYLPMYTERQRERHTVKPGITGWAQVNGRNNVSWKEKMELDLWYVAHLSFKTDCIILLKTIKKVFSKGEIADVETEPTRNDFSD